MEVSANNLTQLIPVEACPNELFGVKLTEAQKADYSLGKPVFLENMQFGDVLKDGKIQLVLDKNGELQNTVDFKESQLEIPKSVLGKDLSEEEIKRLKNGEEVKINQSGKDLFIKIDPELNKIVVRSHEQIKEMPMIGGYNLSDKEHRDLLNGSRLEPKVFKGKDGYFLANVELSPDKKGVVFTNAKPVAFTEVDALLETYNKSNLDKTNRAIEHKSDISTSDLYNAVDLKNYATLEAGAKKGLDTKEVIKYIDNKVDLSAMEKIAMKAILETKDNKNEKGNDNKIESKDIEKIKKDIPVQRPLSKGMGI